MNCTVGRRNSCGKQAPAQVEATHSGASLRKYITTLLPMTGFIALFQYPGKGGLLHDVPHQQAVVLPHQPVVVAVLPEQALEPPERHVQGMGPVPTVVS